MVWMHHVPSLVPRFFDQFVWHRDRSIPTVYLTFDDGPVPGVTDYVLEELYKRNMNATFFMVGDNVYKNSSLAMEVKAAGHQIGNHTHNHPNGSKTKDFLFVENVRACQEMIESKMLSSPALFRPPYGRITKGQRKALAEQYQIVMWDVLPGDFDPGQDTRKCLGKAKQYTRNGSIVVFHDQEKTRTVLPRVLPAYLDWLGDNGFSTGLL
mgnify:CR=1 FL=1